MNRNILALIILVVAIVGLYGLFYAAVATVLMPQDLDRFKADLDTLSQTPTINESDIAELEDAAGVMESYSPLKYLSPDQRAAMANGIRNKNNVPPELLNQNFTEYNNYNNYRAEAYALVLKEDLSRQIKNLSNTYSNLSSLNDEIMSISQKMATDFENGDNDAYAEDLRNMANHMKQYNNEMALLKTQLQTIVNQLGE
ncbi:hypothetical protein FGU46_03735 [Methanobacterium sp. CWC-01]|uniref:hypothetical protein n=1 Tax=Methanobacterium aridiramus TaxID=2584467 RepID=UPI0025756992|nr:hypothetical protein [Methanobacterium sp. CWC-01]WJI09269.1 hypothetical protein FGU46_03735 [Methanobacterium sp. CWC-01]